MKEQAHLGDYPFPKKGCNQAKESKISFQNELKTEAELKLPE